MKFDLIQLQMESIELHQVSGSSLFSSSVLHSVLAIQATSAIDPPRHKECLLSSYLIIIIILSVNPLQLSSLDFLELLRALESEVLQSELSLVVLVFVSLEGTLLDFVLEDYLSQAYCINPYTMGFIAFTLLMN